jgi:hypothetical protein
MSRELTEKDYDIFLDEAYGDVEVAGLKYPTSQVLKEIDPTAYDVGLADWESEQEPDEEAEPEEEEDENL